MKFKDANCGYYSTRREGLFAATFDEVRAICADNGIVSAAWYNCERTGKTVRALNEETLEHCKKCGGVPVLRLLPPSFALESYSTQELEALAMAGAAFRVHPKKDASPLADWMFGDMIAVLERTGAPLLVSVWEYEDLSLLAQFKEKHPDLVLVLTNTNQWLNRQYVAMIKNLKNTYMEISNSIEYNALESLCREVGADRILFGTGMPDKEPYDRIYQMVYAELPQDDLEKIAYRNFERVMERGLN